MLTDPTITAFSLFAGVCFASLYFVCGKKRVQVQSPLLDDIINASDHGLLVFDEDGCLLKSNTLARSKLGAIIEGEFDDLTQYALLDCLFDHAVDFDESIKNTIMNQYSFESVPDFKEVIYLNETRLCLVHARKLNSKMTLFTLIDISKGRQQQENLRQLNTINYQLMEAIQSTTTGIAISDPKQTSNPILFVNDAFCEFTGKNSKDLVGSGWGALMSIFSEDEREKLSKSLDRQENAEIELERTADDQKQYFTMKLSPVFQGGDLDLFIGLMSDITELKQREAEVFQSQKLESLGQLAAGIAHDFNNILSIIGGYATMTAKLLDGQNEKAEKYLEKIEAASDRGAGLTRKMLTFSRHKVVSRSCVSVADIIDEQSDLLLPLLGTSVDLKMSLPNDAVNVSGSASSIQQIVMNLAINGRDAMPEGGTVSIELSCPEIKDIPEHISSVMEADDYIRMAVGDTGTGMDEETIERIFDPFFSTKEQGKGTGLGLSVVYGLVNELGGHLDVESQLGKGTTFYVYLPRSFEEITDTSSAGASDLAELNLDGYTVLVAEDEPDLLHVVKTMLEDLGLNILTARNGKEASKVQEEYEGKIDILLTDAIMPEMNGEKLAKLFSSERPDTKVIFMSGYPAHAKGKPIGIPDDATFIAKPVNYEKLVQVLCLELGIEGNADGAVELPQWKTSNDKAERAS